MVPDKDEPPTERHSYADVREPSYVYPEDDLDDRYRPRRDEPPSPSRGAGGLPYPAEGGIDRMLPGDSTLYSYDSQRPVYRTASPPVDSPLRSSRDRVDDRPPGAFPGDDDGPDPRESKRDRKERKEREREDRRRERDDRGGPDEEDKLKYLPQKYSSRSGDKEGRSRDKPEGRGGGGDDEDKLKYLPSKYSNAYGEPEGRSRDSWYERERREPADDKLRFLPQKYSNKYGYEDEAGSRYSDRERDKVDRRRSKKERDEEDLAYGKPPGPSRSSRGDRPESPPQTYGSYLSGSQLEDRRSSRYAEDDPRRRPASPAVDESGPRRPRRESYLDDPRGEDPRSSQPDVLTVDPGDRGRDRSRDRRRDKSPGPAGLTVETSGRERDRSRDRRGSNRDKSPQPPTARMSTLTVDTGRSSNMSLAAAPASPLLESYRGTYQDCSPMPSPLLLASSGPGDDLKVIEALSPVVSDNEGDGRKRSRRARFHDPEDIATQLANALRGDGPPDKEPLVYILPSLTHEQVMELRAEYKNIVKTGSQRKGVNIAKHIRARLKDENPNLMKACYSVALGRWESDAYWANFWYQGDKTRRELLIEAIMGRTNDEIRRIKDAFTDKKYDNSLIKCMRTELKEDKFKKAVLMVLDERRMEELDAYGRRLPIDYKLVDHDVDDLRQAVKAEKGGESLMISIVVQRSDSHLREVLKEYERAFRSNFARDSLKKSGNLVGEVLAHILNGVINRPVRDALLLHHALTTSRKDELRHELLTSRLVRMHWDAAHMRAVRHAYRERYGRNLQEAVREATSGQWGLFCEELCIARVPNHVKRYEKGR
ncbi:Annexin A7-like protein [Hapsidospora chrysogenum ATCC 11550]|uniref:Annexin A7-like protein n=1 Tax=Hapsidospora chrysogenum (strain ATCC 11550 / CBS 779.69 / DSM 880 / IAM 14645 / JCM 23072 / IMI 49137) TaxID=857340 RepID=A0A086TA34_HAPC1|nr:Annexin A7-like protein [Hapsidospora chrysogenum ATCC 11550]